MKDNEPYFVKDFKPSHVYYNANNLQNKEKMNQSEFEEQHESQNEYTIKKGDFTLNRRKTKSVLNIVSDIKTI